MSAQIGSRTRRLLYAYRYKYLILRSCCRPLAQIPFLFSPLAIIYTYPGEAPLTISDSILLTLRPAELYSTNCLDLFVRSQALSGDWVPFCSLTWDVQ